MSVMGKAADLLKQMLVPLILGFLIVVTVLAGFWDTAEISLYDTWFRVRGPMDPGNKVIIIGMDQKSIDELGPLPWPRRMHAQLLSHLSQAKEISFDLVFDAPTNPIDDQTLVNAIRTHGNVVLAAMFAYEKDEQGNAVMWLKTADTPFLEVAADCGFINMSAEQGNIVRRVTAIDTNMLDYPAPSFSLATLLRYAGLRVDDIKPPKNGRLQVGPYSMKISASNQIMMNYWGPHKTFPVYSYADVVLGRIKPETFKNRIILIGPYVAAEQDDAYQTPFTRATLFYDSSAPTPGIELHASIIQTYLSGLEYTPAPTWVNLVLLFLAWLAIVVVTRRTSPWAGFGLAVALIISLAGLAYFSWLRLHVWVAAAAPMAMLGLNYLGMTVENFIRVEVERRKTRDVFSRYLSPAVVDQIMAAGGEIELGGVKQPLTIMFVDILNFSSFSDGKDPAVVLERLNDYLTVMTRSILNHGGTLDKYIGNGLMAFFGAPVPQADQVERAMRVGLEIHQNIAELNQQWMEKGDIPLVVTLGINTGPAVVGNVGSPERMDYTLIGEDVNLASRVNALCKYFQIRFLVCERSYAKIQDEDLKNSLYFVGEQLVKGFVKPIGVYSVPGMEIEGVAISSHH
ncbi:MAG: CHASE2 domain-containing protein [Solirubrobacterales bacterium]